MVKRTTGRAAATVFRSSPDTNLASHKKRRRFGRVGGIVVLAAALVCVTARPASASTEDTRRVRSTDVTILALLREGAARSATFRALVDAISGSNGVVYIEFGYCALGHLDGCLLPFVVSTHGDRYLRIVVTRDKNRRTHDQLLALIAHELRHALEVLEHDEVVDVRTLEAMYEKIGTPLTGGLNGYETSAARAAGDAVLAELLLNAPVPGRARDERIVHPDRRTIALTPVTMVGPLVGLGWASSFPDLLGDQGR